MAELNLHPTAFPKIEAACPRLDEEQIATLARIAASRHFKAGETLLAAGEQELKFFVVKNGEVELREHCSGAVVTVLGPRQFTGEVDLLAGRPSAVSIIAKADCDTYEVSADALKKIIRDMPRLSDLLLRAFLMRRELIEELGLASVRVIGSRHSKETHRVREFLAKNKIPFSWIDLENDPQVDALLKNFKTEPNETPLVICGENRILRNPSNRELADCLGVRKPIEHTIYDLIIVGAGPAGLAAAVYGASEGLKTLLLDRMGPGGQAGSSSKIENYVGFPTGLSGSDLAERAVVQAEKFGATLSAPDEVIGLGNDGGYHEVMLNGNEKLAAKCVVISSGAAYRKLNVKNNDRFEGTGVYYAATRVEAPLCKHAQVVVVGGGNSAGQAAVFLSDTAKKVFVVIRGDDLSKNMSHYLVCRIHETSNIEVRKRTEVSGMEGHKWLETVCLTNRETGQTEKLSCPAVFVFIGAVPHTKWLPSGINLDSKGFVQTGQQVAESGAWPLQRQPFLLETSVPGVFAAGDVRQGSIKRVAAAVGEGSMAVQFVHQFLAASQKEVAVQQQAAA
ncbi:MAG TPA: FAD-dependent oxidoreductase [Candidatus Udaeobacter sp.]|nr:FAD-dependent oxidoreductase [Candidatus Udaeobacter sp.]